MQVSESDDLLMGAPIPSVKLLRRVARMGLSERELLPGIVRLQGGGEELRVRR